jgi:hypothetical protein
MQVDVKGKVQNLTLSPRDRLVPVLEAIVNSIQATNKGNKADLTVTAIIQGIITLYLMFCFIHDEKL